MFFSYKHTVNNFQPAHSEHCFIGPRKGQNKKPGGNPLGSPQISLWLEFDMLCSQVIRCPDKANSILPGSCIICLSHNF